MTERDIISNNISTNVRIQDLRLLLKHIYIGQLKLGVRLSSFVSKKLAAIFALNLFLTPTGKRYQNPTIKNIFEGSEKDELVLNGVKIKTYFFGNKTNKENILLVHGWSGQAGDYYKMIPVLVQCGFNVVAFDGPAHGLSEGKRTHMPEFAEVIHKVGLKYGGNFKALIGHSFGGGAVLMALENSKDLQVEKVITISSPNKMKDVIKGFIHFMGLDEKVEQEIINIFKKRYGRDIDDVSLEKMYQTVAKSGLVIHDVGDSFVSISALEQIISKNPHLSYLKTDSLGHINILRTTIVHQEIVDFIESKVA